jgi:ABC-type branched-subunit amino acid transport system ATPase component
MTTDQGTTDSTPTEPPATESLVEVDDVSFGYAATPVVRDVSLTVEAGEYVGIIGPNGSGKGTRLRLILGLHRPDSGTIRLLGHPARAFEDRERVGYVAQDATETTTAMPITVEEVVLMGRYPQAGFGRIRSADRELAREALRTVEIEHPEVGLGVHWDDYVRVYPVSACRPISLADIPSDTPVPAVTIYCRRNAAMPPGDPSFSRRDWPPIRQDIL